MPLAVNQILNGRYEIVRSIKSGGMGAVYEASDQNLAGSRCAVKEILESALSSSDADYVLASFTKEMKALAQLNHPGIPRVRDFFELNNNRYIVMDLVQGKALDEELATHLQSSGGAGLEPRKLAQDMVGVVEIVQYLHSQLPPLVHRDIKPANMIRDAQSGRILLVDFGLARSLETINTQTQVGTLGYCAPEQMMGRAEMRSDIYSLGATMAHLLTGRAPNAFNFDAIQIELPGSEGLAKIVERATQPKPEGRYASAADLAEALKRWLADPSAVQPAASPQVVPQLKQDPVDTAPANFTPASHREPSIVVNNNREHLATVLVGTMACATLAFGIHRMTSIAPNSAAASSPTVLSPSASPTKAKTASNHGPNNNATKTGQGKPKPKPSPSSQKATALTHKPPEPTRPPDPPQVAIKPSIDDRNSYPSARNTPNRHKDPNPTQEHLPSVDSPNQGARPGRPNRNSAGDLGSFSKTGNYGYISPTTGTKITVDRYPVGLEDAKAQMQSTGHVLNPSLSPQNEACLYRSNPPHGVHIFATSNPGMVYGLSINYSHTPNQEILDDVQKVLNDFRSHRL